MYSNFDQKVTSSIIIILKIEVSPRQAATGNSNFKTLKKVQNPKKSPPDTRRLAKSLQYIESRDFSYRL